MLTPAASSDPRRDAFSELKLRLQGARGAAAIAIDSCLSSGFPDLDRILGGGFPRGALVTLEGSRSSGRWSIVAALLAAATGRGLGAVIDQGELYPPALAAAGVRLERLLVIPARTPLGIARAADILLRSRVVTLIVMPASSLRAAVWARLAGLAHKAGALLVVIATRASAELAASAGMRLGCALARVALYGTRGVWCTFAGFTVRAELRKHKRLAPGANACISIAVSADGVVVRERAVDRPRMRAVAGER
ncbi:MAG TPA: hypothetical protein VGN11_10115 [Candidatus Baltobacteraceae bacterium]|jgi:hypothetical protein|nr:hypothetical protein [Candidatus Baltobacteraceae bacterium]